MTSRAFCGETWMYFAMANPSIELCVSVSGVMRYPLPLTFRGGWCRTTACRRRCASSRSCRARNHARGGRSLFERCLHRVALERSRGREFAKLVADHLLGDVNGNELPPVVHGDRVPYHLGQDRGTPRPSLHYFLLVSRVHPLD